MMTRAQMRRQLYNNGGISSLRQSYGVGSWVKEKIRKIIPNELADLAVKAAPFVAMIPGYGPAAAGIMRGVGRFDQRGSIGDALKQGVGTYAGGKLFNKGMTSAGFRDAGASGYKEFLNQGTKDSIGGFFKGTEGTPIDGKVKVPGDPNITPPKTPGIMERTTDKLFSKVPFGDKIPQLVKEQFVVGGIISGGKALYDFIVGGYPEPKPGEDMTEYLEKRKKRVGTQMRTYMDSYLTYDPQYSAMNDEQRNEFVARYNKNQGGLMRQNYQTGGISMTNTMAQNRAINNAQRTKNQGVMQESRDRNRKNYPSYEQAVQAQKEEQNRKAAARRAQYDKMQAMKDPNFQIDYDKFQDVYNTNLSEKYANPEMQKLLESSRNRYSLANEFIDDGTGNMIKNTFTNAQGEPITRFESLASSLRNSPYFSEYGNTDTDYLGTKQNLESLLGSGNAQTNVFGNTTLGDVLRNRLIDLESNQRDKFARENPREYDELMVQTQPNYAKNVVAFARRPDDFLDNIMGPNQNMSDYLTSVGDIYGLTTDQLFNYSAPKYNEPKPYTYNQYQAIPPSGQISPFQAQNMGFNPMTGNISGIMGTGITEGTSYGSPAGLMKTPMGLMDLGAVSPSTPNPNPDAGLSGQEIAEKYGIPYASGGRVGQNMGGLMRAGYAMGTPLPNDPTKPINPFGPKPTGPVLPSNDKMADATISPLMGRIMELMMNEKLTYGKAKEQAESEQRQQPYIDERMGMGPGPILEAAKGGLMRLNYMIGGEAKQMEAGAPPIMYSGNMDPNAQAGLPSTPGPIQMAEDGPEFDMRENGGFQPLGRQEGKDDVPAMLAKNEFVMTADAVRAAGGGSIQKGAQKMYDTMKKLESRVS